MKLSDREKLLLLPIHNDSGMWMSVFWKFCVLNIFNKNIVLCWQGLINSINFRGLRIHQSW